MSLVVRQYLSLLVCAPGLCVLRASIVSNGPSLKYKLKQGIQHFHLLSFYHHLSQLVLQTHTSDMCLESV